MKKLLVVLCAVLFVLCSFGVVLAAPLYETLPSDDSYLSPHWVTVDDNKYTSPTEATDLDWAFLWSPSVTGTIDSIDIALSNQDQYFTIEENLANVFIASDSGGVPGTVIDSYNFTNLVSETSGGSVVHGVSASTPLVTAGESYWLWVSAGTPNNNLYASIGVYQNNQNISGTYASLEDGTWTYFGTATPTAAFRISGTPSSVPEPATLLLLGVGLLGLSGFRKKFRKV